MSDVDQGKSGRFGDAGNTESEVLQIGANNSSTVSQQSKDQGIWTDGYNVSSVRQLGFNNTSDVDQKGRTNTSDVDQFGAYNTSTVTQDGGFKLFLNGSG